MARTICRRAERETLVAAQEHELGPLVLVYLNRLSDLLFILARAANARVGHDEPLWKPGATRDYERVAEVFVTALRLGVTSFGGPIAHIAYFRDEYVGRRRWLGEQEFSELVAVTNLLPGPSSSQLGIAIGAHRAGRLGAVASWLGFTLPSAVAMTALALVVGSADVSGAGWVHGLELVAVPVVLLAVLAMRRALAPDLGRLALAIAGAVLAIAIGGFLGQAAGLLLGAVVGILVFAGQAAGPRAHRSLRR